jgi:hypothetical protein
MPKLVRVKRCKSVQRPNHRVKVFFINSTWRKSPPMSGFYPNSSVKWKTIGFGVLALQPQTKV